MQRAKGRPGGGLLPGAPQQAAPAVPNNPAVRRGLSNSSLPGPMRGRVPLSAFLTTPQR